MKSTTLHQTSYTLKLTFTFANNEECSYVETCRGHVSVQVERDLHYEKDGDHHYSSACCSDCHHHPSPLPTLVFSHFSLHLYIMTQSPFLSNLSECHLSKSFFLPLIMFLGVFEVPLLLILQMAPDGDPEETLNGRFCLHTRAKTRSQTMPTAADPLCWPRCHSTSAGRFSFTPVQIT